MTFVTSGLAFVGLLAIAIPIAIHLLARQRRKPIEWAAMRFLIEAFRRHKRRLRIEQLLLLAVRCLIVGLLGLALARPILQATGIIASGGSRAVYLVMDDGLVSGAIGEDGRTALERHVRQAVDLVNGLGPGDAVGVITAARPSRPLLSPPSTDRSAVIQLLQSLESKQAPTDLSGAFSLLRAVAEQTSKSQQPTLVYLFSEFRGGSASLDSPLPATNAGENDSIKFLASPPSVQQVSNVQVTSIDPVRHLVLAGSTDGSEQITVKLTRTGGSLSGDVSSVRLGGENIPAQEPKIVQWQPGQAHAEVKFMVNFIGGTGADRTLGLTASIDDDALRGDNKRYAVVEVRPQIRVLLIDRRSFGQERSLDQLTAGQWIRRALEPRRVDGVATGSARSPMQIVEVEPAALDMADLRTADVAVLPRPDLLSDHGWASLQGFVQRNGLLIITPPAEVNVHQWTESLEKSLHVPWRIAPEVIRHAEGLALAETQPATELLRLISSDLADLTGPVVANILLPVQREAATATQLGSQPLLVFEDGSPLVVAGVPQQDQIAETGVEPNIEEDSGRQAIHADHQAGLVVYLAVAPELSWTNLPSKPLMVPLFQEIVRQGLSVIRASQQWQVGEQPNLAASPSIRQLSDASGASIAVDAAGTPQQAVASAGVYVLQDQTQQPIGKIAVNIDSRAGITDVQSEAAVRSWLNASGPWSTFDGANVAATLAVEHATSPIAGAILLIIIGLLILETILARRFSHAYESTPPGADSGLHRFIHHWFGRRHAATKSLSTRGGPGA